MVYICDRPICNGVTEPILEGSYVFIKHFENSFVQLFCKENIKAKAIWNRKETMLRRVVERLIEDRYLVLTGIPDPVDEDLKNVNK
jgi:hypothetical protein